MPLPECVAREPQLDLRRSSLERALPHVERASCLKVEAEYAHRTLPAVLLDAEKQGGTHEARYLVKRVLVEEADVEWLAR